jgi:hypothetical protein
MTQNDLLEWVRRRPFLPFRIHVSDGATYDIRHPDQAMPLLSTVSVTVSGGLAGAPEAGAMVTISLRHITRLVPIAPPAVSN